MTARATKCLHTPNAKNPRSPSFNEACGSKLCEQQRAFSSFERVTAFLGPDPRMQAAGKHLHSQTLASGVWTLSGSGLRSGARWTCSIDRFHARASKCMQEGQLKNPLGSVCLPPPLYHTGIGFVTKQSLSFRALLVGPDSPVRPKCRTVSKNPWEQSSDDAGRPPESLMVQIYPMRLPAFFSWRACILEHKHFVFIRMQSL